MCYIVIVISWCRPAETDTYVSVALAIPNIIWDSESIISIMFYTVVYKPTTYHLLTNLLFLMDGFIPHTGIYQTCFWVLTEVILLLQEEIRNEEEEIIKKVIEEKMDIRYGF